MKIETYNPYARIWRENEKWGLEENPIFGDKVCEFLAHVEECKDRILNRWAAIPTGDDEKEFLTRWTDPSNLTYCPVIRVIIYNYQRLSTTVFDRLKVYKKGLMTGSEEEKLFYDASKLEYLCSVICHSDFLPPRAVRGYRSVPVSVMTESYLLNAYINIEGEMFFGVGAMEEEIRNTNRPNYRSIYSYGGGITITMR